MKELRGLWFIAAALLVLGVILALHASGFLVDEIMHLAYASAASFGFSLVALYLDRSERISLRIGATLATGLITAGTYFSTSMLATMDLSLGAFFFLVIAMMGAFCRWQDIGFLTVVGAALFFADPDLLLSQAAVSSGLLLLFASISHLLLSRELLMRRHEFAREKEEYRRSLHEEARQFRLISSHSTEETPREQAEELMTRDAVEALHQSIYLQLELLKSAFRCHTCVLLWFDVARKKLHIRELVSDSDFILEDTLDPARGVIGGLTRTREPILLADLKPGFRGIPYYSQPQPVSAFLGIPVLEDGHLRGVLCMDRIIDEPFDDETISVAEETARLILRAVENERVFQAVERSKYELSRFFDASRQLNQVLTPEEVYGVALRCIHDIAPYDISAISLFDPQRARHEIVAVQNGPESTFAIDDWVGRSFDDNQGLASMAIRNRHYLPYGGIVRESRPVVFTPDEELGDVSSMLVLPLTAQDSPMGTLMVAHRKPNIYSQRRREMLEVVANQVAVTIQNARLYARMEKMATTDGLTGLANHRSFQNKLDEAIARHRRNQRTFSIILTDIDHFKPVNDTYGHPVGDEVLRQVSACFMQTLRETDFAARYGGEEFAMILDETDAEGAFIIAERLRNEIKKLVFQTEKGPFSITISMGIGQWPLDAEHKQALVDFTDQALYHSKHNGRDRATLFQDIARKAS